MAKSIYAGFPELATPPFAVPERTGPGTQTSPVNAIWLRATAELRSRWRAWVGLIAVIGLTGGIVIAAVAGARRTDSAYPRFLEAQNAGQGAITSDAGHFFGYANVDFSKVERFPEVAQTARLVFFVALIRTPSGLTLTPIASENPVVLFASPDDRFDRVLDKMRARQGRLPDPARADEVAVSDEAARRYRIKVGDVLRVHLPTFADLSSTASGVNVTGPLVGVRVTAIEVSPGELGSGIGYPPLHFTSAFYARYASTSPNFPALAFKLHSDSQLPSFLDRVQSTAIIDPQISSRVEFLSVYDNSKAVERTTHVQALALWLLALLTGLTALLILVQAIIRQVFLESFDNTTLAALGLTRSQMQAIVVLRTGVVAAAGAGLAALVAFLLSGLSPIGVARLAEPHPGLALDGLVIGLGAAAVIVVVPVMAFYPALRMRRITAVRRPEAPDTTSSVAEAFARSGFQPPAAAGVRMALEVGRGRNSVPVRSTIGAAVVSIAAIVTALTFAASIDRVVHTPHLQGVNWSGVVGDDFDPEDAAAVVPALRAQRHITEFSEGGAATLSIGGHSVTTLGMNPVKGSIKPVLVEGRTPVGDNEIALGIRTTRELHTRVGATIEASSGRATRPLLVVGRTVAPTVADEAFNGRGAWMTLSGLRTMLPGNATDIYLFRVDRPASLPAVEGTLHNALPGLAIGSGPTGGDVDVLARVSNLPLVLAGVLALLSLATLAHLIVTAVRARRQEFAVLKTLGFVGLQVRQTVAWYATTVALVALVLALPIGYVTGRIGWGLLANEMGFLSDPTIKVWQVLAIVPLALVAVNMIGVVPSWSAASAAPALEFRRE